jgi:hypothetical protein
MDRRNRAADSEVEPGNLPGRQRQPVQNRFEGGRTIRDLPMQQRALVAENGHACFGVWNFQSHDRVIERLAVQAKDGLNVEIEASIGAAGYFGSVTALGTLKQVGAAHGYCVVLISMLTLCCIDFPASVLGVFMTRPGVLFNRKSLSAEKALRA